MVTPGDSTMNSKILVACALELFAVMAITEHVWPSIIGSRLWHPIPIEAYVAWGLYCAPSLPSLIAFALLALSLVVDR
jgi:hypothetical protein